MPYDKRYQQASDQAQFGCKAYATKLFRQITLSRTL